MVERWNLTNPQGNEWNLLSRKNHEDHIAGKGLTSMTHDNQVNKFIPVLQAMKIPDAKAALDREWKKFEAIPAWQLEKVKSKKEVFWKHKETKKKVHFATLMDICHLKNAELVPNFRILLGRVVLRDDVVKDDSQVTQFLLSKARLRPR